MLYGQLNSFLRSAWKVVLTHWIFLLVFTIAVTIRFYHIQTEIIFIGDQGRDFLVSSDMIHQHSIPLLGIPSSLPRFRQGPLYIYFTTIALLLGREQVLAAGVMATLFGLAAIVALYLLLDHYATKKIAIIATTLFAFTPMAILQSRMPFVINMVPFFVILYLWQLLRMSEGKRYAVFLTAFLFGCVFQGELATFPLFLFIPYIYLQKHLSVKKTILPLVSGLVLGLLPEIIYDITHGFSQLGAFLIWVVYRIVAAVIPVTHTTLVSTSLPSAINMILHTMANIFAEGSVSFAVEAWILLVILLLVFSLRHWKHYPLVLQLSIGGTALLLASFVIHRAPSEAYFPAFLPLACVMLIVAIDRLPKRLQMLVFACMFISLTFSTSTLIREHFLLVMPQDTEGQGRRFGPSLLLQEQVLLGAQRVANGECVRLESIERDQTFPTTIDNFQYLAKINNISGDVHCQPIVIDTDTFAQSWKGIETKSRIGNYRIGVYQ